MVLTPVTGSDVATSGCKLRVEGVSKTYGAGSDKVLALDNINLLISERAFVCIVGPSGCGKTTLLNMFAGFDFPTTGNITLDGKTITGPDADRGVVFQQGALLPWKTILGNVAFGPQCRGIERRSAQLTAQRSIELVGLSGFEQRFPYELSGGMQQRVGIARVFANRPSCLLMDEPFAALDAQTRELLQEEMKRIWNTTRQTAVWITHSIEEALFLATDIVVMTARPGRIKRQYRNTFSEAKDLRITGTVDFVTAKQEITDCLRDEAISAQHQERLRND